MTYQDYERLGFVDFKAQLINFASQRIQALQSAIENDMPETSYLIILGKIDELEKLLQFAKDVKFSSVEDTE